MIIEDSMFLVIRGTNAYLLACLLHVYVQLYKVEVMKSMRIKLVQRCKVVMTTCMCTFKSHNKSYWIIKREKIQRCIFRQVVRVELIVPYLILLVTSLIYYAQGLNWVIRYLFQPCDSELLPCSWNNNLSELFTSLFNYFLYLII